jgi:hydroxymethylbilane synthase
LDTIRIATRTSALARWQAARVAEMLRAATGVDTELVSVTTSGDAHTEVAIHELGGTGVFVKEVQQAVIEGVADIAVHSAKDLPSETPPELVLACVPERGDPRDALVGNTVASLPLGATVATGSVRRRVQLYALRPDLGFAELRGNIATRLERAAGFDAIVVATAALDRLGLRDRATEVLDSERMLPQVGQGALAVECGAGDATTQALLARIDDAGAHRCVRAERAFLRGVGGGCDLPVGALASIEGGDLVLTGLLADGLGVPHRASERGGDPETLGALVAAALR